MNLLKRVFDFFYTPKNSFKLSERNVSQLYTKEINFEAFLTVLTISDKPNCQKLKVYSLRLSPPPPLEKNRFSIVYFVFFEKLFSPKSSQLKSSSNLSPFCNFQIYWSTHLAWAKSLQCCRVFMMLKIIMIVCFLSFNLTLLS